MLTVTGRLICEIFQSSSASGQFLPEMQSAQRFGKRRGRSGEAEDRRSIFLLVECDDNFGCETFAVARCWPHFALTNASAVRAITDDAP